jgi:hypothetical protein
VLVILVLGGYLAVAAAARNLYPFSTFPMYSGSGASGASRIFARLGDGSLREVTDLSEWSCPRDFDWSAPGCDARGIGYLERKFASHIRAAEGNGREAVDVVRRDFRFTLDGSLKVEECTLARCRATP